MMSQIVVYSATRCMPCGRLHPVLKSLEEEGYRVTRRDVDREVDQLQYQYDAVPTIHLVRNHVVMNTETGYRSKAQLKQRLIFDSPHQPIK